MSDFIDMSAMLGPGVYALVVRDEIVYVGKAKKLLQRIYAHKNNWRKSREGSYTIAVRAIYFTAVWIHPCKESDLNRIERVMISKYKPRENTNLIPKDRTLTLEDSGFNFIVMGVKLQPEPTHVLERRF